MRCILLSSGNREMYQNCAAVTVIDGGSGLTGPSPFVANINVNQCRTIAKEDAKSDLVFPDPGPLVYYGGEFKTSHPTTPAAFEGSNCVGPGPSASEASQQKTQSENVPPSNHEAPPASAVTPSVTEAVPSETPSASVGTDVSRSPMRTVSSSMMYGLHLAHVLESSGAW